MSVIFRVSAVFPVLFLIKCLFYFVIILSCVYYMFYQSENNCIRSQIFFKFYFNLVYKRPLPILTTLGNDYLRNLPRCESFTILKFISTANNNEDKKKKVQFKQTNKITEVSLILLLNFYQTDRRNYEDCGNLMYGYWIGLMIVVISEGRLRPRALFYGLIQVKMAITIDNLILMFKNTSK